MMSREQGKLALIEAALQRARGQQEARKPRAIRVADVDRADMAILHEAGEVLSGDRAGRASPNLHWRRLLHSRRRKRG